MNNLPIPSEHAEQSAFFTLILLKYRTDPRFIRPLFFSVPNGAWLGGKSAFTMEKMKEEGLTPGVADILYLQPRGAYAFLAIEMKRADKRGRYMGGLREEQVAFMDAAQNVGGCYVVCYSAEEAEQVFEDYLKRT